MYPGASLAAQGTSEVSFCAGMPLEVPRGGHRPSHSPGGSQGCWQLGLASVQFPGSPFSPLPGRQGVLSLRAGGLCSGQQLPLVPASLSPHPGQVTKSCSPGAGHPRPGFPVKYGQCCQLLRGFLGGRNKCDLYGVPESRRGSFIHLLPLLGLVVSLPPHPGKTVGTELGWNLFPSPSFCSDPGQSRAQEVGRLEPVAVP